MKMTKEELLREIENLKAEKSSQNDEIKFLRQLVQQLTDKIGAPQFYRGSTTFPMLPYYIGDPPGDSTAFPAFPYYIGDPPVCDRPYITCATN